MFFSYGVFTPLVLIFLLIRVASLVAIIVALIDAARTHEQAFAMAGKQTKQIWLIILGVALLFTLVGGFLSILSLVAAIVYLVDVKPAVRDHRPRSDGQRMGPYGPW